MEYLFKDENVLSHINHLHYFFKTINKSWYNFYSEIYQFRNLKTDLGYFSLSCEDGSIIKKSVILKKEFNISKSLYSKICSMCDKFFDTSVNPIVIQEKFSLYNRSALMEFLAMTSEELIKALEDEYITPESSVKQIRDYIKSLKENELDKITKPTLEELKDLPKTEKTINKYYVYSDLKKYKKVELIDMYLELQRVYKKIKEIKQK